MFRAGRQVSWYEWILPISSWDFTIRTFICPFFMTFSVIIPWQHVIWCQKWMIWAIGPMAYVPTKFHWDSFKRRWNLTNLTAQKTFTTTTPIIIIITRGTVPRGTVDPIPNDCPFDQGQCFARWKSTIPIPLMVTMALSARVSKLQPSEICLT